MSRSSANLMVMPHARSNSAIRPGAVGGESHQQCGPTRHRWARSRARSVPPQDLRSGSRFFGPV